MLACILIKIIYFILLKENINISLDHRSRIFQNLNGALGEMAEGSQFLLGMQQHAHTRNKVVLWLKGLNFRNSCPCRTSSSKKPLPEFWDLFAIPLWPTRFTLQFPFHLGECRSGFPSYISLPLWSPSMSDCISLRDWNWEALHCK